MAISCRPARGNLWILSLCLILSLTLSGQGAPVQRERTIPKSAAKPASEDPSQLRKAVGRAEIPLLPPGEELGLTELGSKQRWFQLADSEEDGVSGDGGFGMRSEWVSGDDEAPLDSLISFQNPKKQNGKPE
ncbi:hypothetical protein scyTo_0021194 [Scyliorhinus torazame]|uniref:Uncharacterized protein n=1 Tax=Scyliorhinus torazame TaxID=75743 RepID=A0A401PZ17_SCYTO|nr:hypothetical protein [Scyliorhinus torazame]